MARPPESSLLLPPADGLDVFFTPGFGTFALICWWEERRTRVSHQPTAGLGYAPLSGNLWQKNLKATCRTTLRTFGTGGSIAERPVRSRRSRYRNGPRGAAPL